MSRDSDRKYRQQGYRQPAGEPRERRQAPRPPDTGAPRPLGLAPSRTVSRCAKCGTLLTVLAEPSETAPSAGSRCIPASRCSHFDPGRRFECAQPVPERISDKSARNDCASVSLRATVERDTSGGATRPDDARRAFDNLFGN
jgi:hypothetical protein